MYDRYVPDRKLPGIYALTYKLLDCAAKSVRYRIYQERVPVDWVIGCSSTRGASSALGSITSRQFATGGECSVFCRKRTLLISAWHHYLGRSYRLNDATTAI